jgi:hypothetical protein
MGPAFQRQGDHPMTKAQSAIVAGAVAMLLATATVRADNTVRLLAGTGSLNDAANASTMTLNGGDAHTQAVCYWPRLWRYGSCGPVCPPVVCAAPAYYPPTYYSAPATAPPVAPMTYYYPQAPAAPEVVAAAPTPYASSRPSIIIGYQGRFFGGSIAIRPGARLAGFARPTEDLHDAMPPPRPNDTFRYDGGPSQPVPMPVPDPVSPTEPVPMTVPALQRVQFERSRSRVAYPAYGEKPTSRTAVADPLLVKRAANP